MGRSPPALFHQIHRENDRAQNRQHNTGRAIERGRVGLVSSVVTFALILSQIEGNVYEFFVKKGTGRVRKFSAEPKAAKIYLQRRKFML